MSYLHTIELSDYALKTFQKFGENVKPKFRCALDCKHKMFFVEPFFLFLIG